MLNKLVKSLTKKEAQRRTAKHRQDFKRCLQCWSKIAKEVKESIDMGVPAKLGMTMRAWLFDTFPEKSASHLYRLIADIRALDGVPQEQIEKIPEGNAHELATRLPDEVRKRPDVIEKAVRQKPAEFKKTVSKIREKLGVKTEQWETFAVRLPVSVMGPVRDAIAKLGRVLQVDLEDDNTRGQNMITVMEAWASLVNQTDESQLKVEIEGGGALEEASLAETESVSQD